MSTEPLNTQPIQQFIKQVQAAENSRAKDVRIDIMTAKNLAFTMGIVMSRLQGDMESYIKENSGNNLEDTVIKIDIDAGNSW